MNNKAAHTVVLAGGAVQTRQQLAKQLQLHLSNATASCVVSCPASPQELVNAPADARYLLWRNPQDETPDPAHQAWREQLHALQRPYQSVLADAHSLLQQALYALAPGGSASSARPQVQRHWQGLCECCADPACEQQLFGRLLQG